MNRRGMVCHSGLDPESSDSITFLDSGFRQNDI